LSDIRQIRPLAIFCIVEASRDEIRLEADGAGSQVAELAASKRWHRSTALEGTPLPSSPATASIRNKPRRVVAKVEWHPGELYPPRTGFIVTNLARPAERVVGKQRGRVTRLPHPKSSAAAEK
jgi:hypothetical protein